MNSVRPLPLVIVLACSPASPRHDSAAVTPGDSPTVAMAKPRPTHMVPATHEDSVSIAAAVDAATQRMREHQPTGFSIGDVKRTQDWFTSELYSLLVADMSDPGGIGYLNADPFTDAQDDVGPSRLEDAWIAGDTVMVRFSREDYQRKRDSITLAMRRIGASWRIADFVYSRRSSCPRALSVGLTLYAQAPGVDPCR
jgi:hypothetical protein